MNRRVAILELLARIAELSLQGGPWAEAAKPSPISPHVVALGSAIVEACPRPTRSDFGPR